MWGGKEMDMVDLEGLEKRQKELWREYMQVPCHGLRADELRVQINAVTMHIRELKEKQEDGWGC